VAQTLVDEIIGPAITDTALGNFPPDTMGAVGPTQFLFSVNGRFRAFNKNSPHTQIADVDQQVFWFGVADPAGVSDGHVRYDESTQRWFITEIDTPASDNHILLAVSSGPDLSTASWSLFALAGTGGTVASDMGCFADYDTPGIDQNAIYIGENMFCGVAKKYTHSNLYVIQKSSALTSTVNFTSIYNVVTPTVGMETIQGVDSVDSLATGYAIAVNETESPRQHLSVWQIHNPGTTSPTLSGPTDVAINAENGARGGVLSANNVASADPTRQMSDIDDRLFSAVIRNGHLWTAHNIGVDSTGNANSGSPTRDAVRWFDVTVSGLTLNQSGTVYDSASSGFLEYWMGTMMVSGQGHVAMGLNHANSTTVVQAGAVGRLAGDALGTMSGFSLFQTSTADAYDDKPSNPTPANRWGDYTYTSLDPCDDMTMWTAQEYVAGSAMGDDWGVAAEKLQAPPPATPTSASPSLIPAGLTNLNVAVIGTSASGSGFYDTPSTLTDPCRKRLAATVSGGVTVNSITYTDPTHITLNVSTVSATPGLKNLTITNPDGQVVIANNFLTIQVTPGLLRVTTSPAVPSQITVDGNIADTWGLNWVKLAPGSHMVCFTSVQGFTTPACQTVTISSSATTTVTGTFVQRGFLKVQTSPAVPSTISVDGTRMDDWGVYTDLPTGSHMVCFGLVPNFTPPGCQTAIVTAGGTTTITGTFTSSPGASGETNVGLLRVTTSPAVVSQISVDGNIADTWGLNWVKLAPGSHTVCFSSVQGFTTPACQTVTVSTNATTTVTGAFAQRGFLQVHTSPASAGTVFINGSPADDWGVYTDLPPGTYQVCFGVAGSFANTPACQSAVVTGGATTTITGTYS
jgi:hypothetical protein